MKNIEDKLKAKILELSNAKVNPDEITEHTNLIDDLTFDSVQIVQMIAELEDEFDIIFEDDDMDVDILTDFGNLFNLIKSKV